MQTISIGYCADCSTNDKYLKEILISLQSLLQHVNKTYYYEIYLLFDKKTANQFDPNIYKKPNVNINILIDNHYFDETNAFRKTKGYFLRYEFIQLLKDKTDKIIYMDGDTIVNDDLVKLYNTDISNCHFGACHDAVYKKWPLVGKPLIDFFPNFTRQDDYFNTGVLLINIKKCNDDNAIEVIKNKSLQFWIYKNNAKLRWQDQEAFNNSKLKIKKMEIIYNFNPSLQMHDKTNTTFTNDISDNNILERVSIFHFYCKTWKKISMFLSFLRSFSVNKNNRIYNKKLYKILKKYKSLRKSYNI